MSNLQATISSWLVSKLLKTQYQHFRPILKVNPFIVINKIQQAKPSYKYNLINKQIAYDVIIDTQQAKTQKLYNCICAARPNSQIFKRISKQFLYNLKNGINQLLFFGGRQAYSRMQSSIGLPSNPGLFMIAAIAILDQKYKDHHQRCDVQFSFLQFKDGQIYDLLNYTQTPLKIQQKTNSNLIGFNQQYVKVFTFLQFIKLFKIALFNNKQRDLKTESAFRTNNELKSILIMKIKTKRYNLEGQLILQQQTALVDYDQGCFKAGKQKQGKSLFDYLLIEINNSNPINKPIHYHMVEKNSFISLFKNYLRIPNVKQKNNNDEQSEHAVGGQVIFINSISSNKEQFPANSAYLSSIYSAAGEEWQSKVIQKNRWSSYFNVQFTKQKFSRIIESIIVRNYSTLSQFYQVKDYYNQQIKRLKYWIKQYKNLINSHFILKRQFKCLQNLNIGFQLQLIGGCIKSDNFKDFYNSKSYISLGRQILIKTQNIKQQIQTCFNQIAKVKDDFVNTKKKQINARTDSMIPQIIKLGNIKKNQKENKYSETKFKPLLTSNTIHVQFNELEAFQIIKTHIFQYLYQIWDKVTFSEQRTLAQDIIFQQSFLEQCQNMNKILNNFILNCQKIQQNEITCHKGDLILSKTNFYQLLKTFNLTKQSFLKEARFKSKHFTKNAFFVDKKQKNQKIQFPKLKQNYKNLFTEHNLNKAQDKQQIIRKKSLVIQVKGKIDFAKMMINPSQGLAK